MNHLILQVVSEMRKHTERLEDLERMLGQLKEIQEILEIRPEDEP